MRAYLDRTRPTMAMLYKLMLGAVDVEDVNARRDSQGRSALAVEDLETFAVVNARRGTEGLPPLPIPSRSTFERAVRRLDPFEVCAARYGIQQARRRFKIAGRREAAMAAGERVAIDSWRFQLMMTKLPQQAWAGLPKELIGRLAALRLNACVAVCEATKVPLGVRLSVNADSDTVLRTLEMVCRDKSDIAAAAGCRSTWHHACTPESVPFDSGPENIEANVRWAIRDIGAVNVIGPARHPDARPWVERFFATLDVQFAQFFQGRTFSGVGEKGDYDPGAAANVVVEVLGKSLVRYLVDVYLNSPHAGLGGQTPNDAWEEKTARYGLIPPPAAKVLRAVFGFADTRRIQNRGIRFLGLRYRSKELGRLRMDVGQEDVRIRVDLSDLGAISVCRNKPGSRWFTVPCETDMTGVCVEEWLGAAADLRRRHASTAKLREPIVLAALRDLRIAGKASARAAGIGPSTTSRDEILQIEKEQFKHFDIVVSDRRGRTFEGLDDEDDAAEAAAAKDDPSASDDAGEHGDVEEDGVTHAPVRRRRGRHGADFLKED
ncbi:Mu transposase C-terminal domain-containing protein [uncultured Aureimonas sp.]|uniref:Mu transposase C-terminal domain-containing protein n=1 Tax=uncultured Aureimonas sp. TaxID=1604662 RepID=UPI0025F9FD16|nr:Mu transposase C-terminal domain-containing protein [uncultured Aureimonas sp.]